jgi:hypothetical protein
MKLPRQNFLHLAAGAAALPTLSRVLPLFADRALDVRCEDIWFNGWRQVNRFLSVKQGEQSPTC